ncbi:RagB/SusD family nutrient uptake outer membrane protein [Dokdonia sinensis]|uniref:RagB/SusD family nutrient uptake outer membrane protein n=1 Tax=Dokdonia sinensis TaxID=2479847 RepID=A0A3M0GN48_9FLAO|nr:RagB/SusD family nutrient uptake outer membrane protein [Dokdonia sinensis]RMB64162.1 RagB/SusD family nutrient uptake outer membrane protein [Dokdonia sinensis]
MKKYIIAFAALTALFSSFSCEDALDESPETFFSEEQIYSTEQGVESVINGLYQSMADPGYHGSSMHGLIMPISGKFFSNQGASEDATSLNCSPVNTWITRLWPQMYTTVNIANGIILNLENTDVALENRETALAQAYFIRAVTYFDLVRWFGEVPLRLEPSTNETLHVARAPKSEVYAQIISDFEKAAATLPDFGEYLEGRPVKYAANAYLAKVYMQMAGEDNGNPAFWQNAKNEALKVIGRYSLNATYAEIFDLSNENSEESIFELQYGQNGALRNSDVIRFYTPRNSVFTPDNTVTFGRIRPNKETFDQHVNQYPEDPRIEGTFVFGSYEQNNGSERTIYPERTSGNDGYAVIRKYFDPNFNGTTTNRNFIKFRYADLLLMLAEIENELNGPANAYQYVNEVLARARTTEEGEVTEPQDFAGMDQDEFRTRILRERQYELLAEGHIWFDTRRRGYQYFLDEVVTPHNTHPTFDENTDFVYPVSVKNMLLPIPSNEISGNQAITPADQNPGY